MRKEKNNTQEKNMEDRNIIDFPSKEGDRNKEDLDSKIMTLTKQVEKSRKTTMYIVGYAIFLISCIAISLLVSSYILNSGYYSGYRDAANYLQLRDEIAKIYKGDAISYEQLSSYADIHFKIIESVESNGEISTKDIKNYNKIIEELGLEDKYELRSNKSYLKGFTNYLLQSDLTKIITYYHDSGEISDELYDGYLALDKVYDISEENIIKICIYEINIIQRNIGSINEVILQTDWKEYKSAEDFLKKISAPK